MDKNPIFSYTKRDYESARLEGLSRIPSISNGAWTDLNATDPGIIILDYVHALVDMINYYQDHQALEAFISTAKERANVFRLAKQLSYKIRSAKGAECNVEFTSSLPQTSTIKIPKYTVVSTPGGIKYLTSEDSYLLPGSLRVNVPCIQGELGITAYKGTGISRFSNIVNATNQSVRLVAANDIDIESISIVDSIGREWKSVEYITYSDETERVYQVDLNPDNSITIRFGDGERGVVPSENDLLTIAYVTTLGDKGKVGKNSITILADQIYNTDGKYVEFTVNNNKDSVGGSAPPTSQEIRELAPGAIKAQDRAVTLQDFEDLAKLVDGVLDAKAYDINTNPDLCLHHEVKVLITPKESTADLDILKSKVHAYLSKRIIPPTNLQIILPEYNAITIDIKIRKLDNTTEGRVSYAIQQAVYDFFSKRSSSIGESFYPSDLVSVLSNIEGIRNIISITPNTEVSTDEFSVLVLGNLNISVV